MHPLGCFGSSLAYEPESSVCSICSAVNECRQKVEDRQPLMLQLLSKFSDNKGQTMAEAWVSCARTRRSGRNDRRADAAVVRLMKNGIDPKTAPLDQIATTSKAMAEIIAVLRVKQCTLKELVAEVTLRCAYSASTAQRETYTALSILTSSDRATRTGPNVELK